MRLRRHFLRATLALLGALGATTTWAVTIHVQGKVEKPGAHTLVEHSRLLTAINQAQPGADVYWLGAHYARRAHLGPQAQLKADVLARLRARRMEAAKDHADDTLPCLDQLEQTLTGMPVTGRLAQALDPQTLDLDPRANRQLQEGDSLLLPTRPDYVLIQGLVRQELKLPYQHGQPASQYLAQAALCAGADRNHAWIIYPDGSTRRVGIAYWNEVPVNLAPGARLLIPVTEGRWDNAAHTLSTRTAEFLATQPLP